MSKMYGFDIISPPRSPESFQTMLIKILAENYASEIVGIVYSDCKRKRIGFREPKNLIAMMAHRYKKEFISIFEEVGRDRREARECFRTGMAWTQDPKNSTGFDTWNIRWLFEGRLGQPHPEEDWDHPAWAHPDGICSGISTAYDED